MAEITKAKYLERYLSAGSGTNDHYKPKKKKLKKVSGAKSSNKRLPGFKIVDEDIDLSQIGIGSTDVDDENPTVAEIIDERPDSIKHMEIYAANDKWKKVIGGDVHGSSPNKEDVPEKFKSRKYQDLDNSPPRTERHESDNSPPRRERHDSDSSLSGNKRHDSDSSPLRRKRHDSDNSPPRRKRHDSDNSPPRRKRQDSDNSPPRSKGQDSDNSPPRRKRQDSDNSPPRRKRQDSDSSPPRRNANSNITSPTTAQGDATAEVKKTLSGKAAGLSSAKDMKREAAKLKIKEMEMFNKIGNDKLGKNAEAVFRDKSGKRRDLKAEKQTSDAKAAEWKDKYEKWGKGVAQRAAEQQRVAEMAHEMNKPLARSRDDVDLDSHLKQVEREGDPMLKYMKQKKESKNKGPKYPQYKGPAPEPNRFGINPGYRWDGVDRGNGFEKKYFQSISKRTAVSADAYKWSTEDM